MKFLLKIGMWLFLWPVLVPIWLWKRGKLGQVLAGIWSVFFFVLIAISGNTQPNSVTAPVTEQKQMQLQKTDAQSSNAVVPTFTPTAIPQPTSTQISQPTSTSISQPTLIPTIQATDTPVPVVLIPDTPEPTIVPLFVTSRTNGAANLRNGPSTNFAVQGTLPEGESIDIVARSQDGSWYQLRSGEWIAAFLVNDAPTDLAIAESPPEPIINSNLPGNNNPQAFTCNGGCAISPDPSCAIKGNVNSKKEKIYHTPSSRDYDRTDIKPEEGDRWFCTENEAQAAGFRAPRN